MLKKARRLAKPAFIGKVCTCACCGGQYKITRFTRVTTSFTSGNEYSVHVSCPYCNTDNRVYFDVNRHLRDRLKKFVYSQVDPIKTIEDEKIRLPMQNLLDDFNKLLEED